MEENAVTTVTGVTEMTESEVTAHISGNRHRQQPRKPKVFRVKILKVMFLKP